MRALVTGGAGYLGSKLCIELTKRGHDVISIDRQDGDLSEPGVFIETLESHLPIDRVVHLAAMPGREFCERAPAEAVRQNALMTTLVARACGFFCVPLCYVSTSEVYGRTMDIERYVNESDPLRPRNTYALTKVWGEQACELYAPEGLVVLRPSMPYSGEMEVGFGRAALPTMIRRALDGDTITVHNGTSRSWTYCSDVIKGMATAIEHGEGAYNVGSEENERTMDELATTICAMTGADKKLISYQSPPPTVSPHKRLSSARLRYLGWHPKISLDEGIRLTIEQLQSHA